MVQFLREDGALDQGGKTDMEKQADRKRGSRRMLQVRPGWLWVGIPTLRTPPRKKPSAKGEGGAGVRGEGHGQFHLQLGCL